MRHARISYLLLLFALDIACVFAMVRIPSRLVLAPGVDRNVPRAPGLVALTPRRALFVGTDQHGETTLAQVPLSASDPATVTPVGHDFALLEPVRGMDALMPTGSRWAWSGRSLLVAAPARALGKNEVYVFVVGADGAVSPTRTIEGTRPSAGWAGDHFEVAYVTPAPSPAVGRVQWVVDASERGELANARIVEGAGEIHTPYAWPHGVRSPIGGAEPWHVVMPDGALVRIPRAAHVHVLPWFDLDPAGGARVHFARASVTEGAEIAGDYTEDIDFGDLRLVARLGAHRQRLRFVLSRPGRRVAFETAREPQVTSLVAMTHDGVVSLLDARGFRARFRESDLEPLEARGSRVAFLYDTLGSSMFAAWLLGLVFAHVLALTAARTRRSDTFARFCGMTALFFGTCAGLVVWYAV